MDIWSFYMTILPMHLKNTTMTKSIAYYFVKAVSILLTTVIIVLCAFFGFLYYCNIRGMEVPTLGSLQMYIVLSESMEPKIFVNDAIIINTSVTSDDLAVGDVITFRAFESDVIITHRIIDIERTEQGYEYRTKGDNNPSMDTFTTPEDRVIGRYVMKLPQLAAILAFTVERPYLIALIVVSVILVQLLLGFTEKKLKPVPALSVPTDEITDEEILTQIQIEESEKEGTAQTESDENTEQSVCKEESVCVD